MCDRRVTVHTARQKHIFLFVFFRDEAAVHVCVIGRRGVGAPGVGGAGSRCACARCSSAVATVLRSSSISGTARGSCRRRRRRTPRPSASAPPTTTGTMGTATPPVCRWKSVAPARSCCRVRARTTSAASSTRPLGCAGRHKSRGFLRSHVHKPMGCSSTIRECAQGAVAVPCAPIDSTSCSCLSGRAPEAAMHGFLLPFCPRSLAPHFLAVGSRGPMPQHNSCIHQTARHSTTASLGRSIPQQSEKEWAHTPRACPHYPRL